jgi:hypothetical protein
MSISLCIMVCVVAMILEQMTFLRDESRSYSPHTEGASRRSARDVS